ncbi:MAG: hypothetical protein F2839_06360, partial [Actinobacteria bacterium]|nr:hypothetical protein [Actinomycetota bacterium]
MNRAQRRRTGTPSRSRKLVVGSLALGGLVASNLVAAAPAFATETTVGCDKDELKTAIDSDSYSKITVAFATPTCLMDLGSGANTFNIDGQTLEIAGPSDKTWTIKASTAQSVFNVPRTSVFTLKNVTIQGTGTNDQHAFYLGGGGLTSFTADYVTVTSFDNNSVLFDAGMGALSSIAISHSSFTDNYAAIYAEGNLTISDSAFSNNSGGHYGSAITMLSGSTGTITGSTFTGNSSTLAGGAIWSEGTLTVSDSTFTGNTATAPENYDNFGGAIDSGSSSSLSVSHSTFDSNVAGDSNSSGYGGAISSFGENSVFEGNLFTDNSASLLGGALAVGVGMALNNSTFVDNSATYDGAIYSEGGLISNSTFMNNSTTNTAEYSMGGDSSVALFANIVASDSAAQKLVDPDLLDVAENLVTDDSLVLIPGSHSQKNVTLAQLNLKPLALYTKTPANSGTTKTIGLGQGSIARDYYSELPIAPGALPSSYHPMGSLSLPTVDQRGVARVQGAAYDVGAYEGPAATICTPGVL